MKNEKLSQALNEVEDRYIQEAAAFKRTHKPLWYAAAACLALCVLIGALLTVPGRPNIDPTINMDVPPSTDAFPNTQPSIPVGSTGDGPLEFYDFILFQPNEAADGYIQTDYSIEELNPVLVLQALQEAGVLNADVSYTTCTIDGDCRLTLDLNAAFLAQLLALNAEEEALMIGCLVNTFLSAYRYTCCDRMMITVEGQTLQTNHAVYNQFLFADNLIEP